MSAPVKIPADLEKPDRVVAGWTARQVVILAGTAVLVYAGWLGTRTVLPTGVFVAAAVPVAVAGVALALFRHRDGISLDRHALAALGYRLRPRLLAGPPPPLGEPAPSWLVERVAAVELEGDLPHLPGGRCGRLRLPAHDITDPAGAGVGVLHLGGHGMAAIAAAAPVPFGLRGEDDQDQLVGCFARMLHAADGPMQILVRTHPLDLSAALDELAHAAAALTHPALRAAAREHLTHLRGLAAERILTRQVLLILREPTPAGATAHAAAAPTRLIHRLQDAARALAPAGIGLTPLDPATAQAVLATVLDPDRAVPTPYPADHTSPDRWSR